MVTVLFEMVKTLFKNVYTLQNYEYRPLNSLLVPTWFVSSLQNEMKNVCILWSTPVVFRSCVIPIGGGVGRGEEVV